MRGRNLGMLTAIVVAIVVATGLFTQERAENRHAAAPSVELTLSLETMEVELRAGVFTLQVDL